MLKLNHHFEKSYRSVQLIAATAMFEFYYVDFYEKEENDPLIVRTRKFNEFLIKETPGFYFCKMGSLKLFFIELFEKLHIDTMYLLFSWNPKKDYQKALNYLYDNFTNEELEEIFTKYLDKDASDAYIDTKCHIDFTFNRI